MTPPEDSPFYIGYHKRAPAELSRYFRKLLMALGLIAVAGSLTLAARQRPADPGSYELGRQQTFLGRIQEHPSPVLWLSRPDRPGTLQSSYDLVAVGKHGAARLIQGLDGRWVTLSGALIHRPGRALIEVATGSVKALDPAGSSDLPAREELGSMELVGEIVDGKCYAGVMKPGRGKPHRDCAVRCISGGIPGVFVVEANDGAVISLDLVDEEEMPVSAKLLDRVAEPLIVRGRVVRQGDRLILRAAPSAFRRWTGTPPNP